MRFIKSLSFIFWIAVSLSPTTAQIHWKEVKSVEDFYEAYPERLIFMFDQINLDRKGLESVKQYHDKQNYVAASIALLDYYKKSKTVKKYRKSQPPISSSKITQELICIFGIYWISSFHIGFKNGIQLTVAIGKPCPFKVIVGAFVIPISMSIF